LWQRFGVLALLVGILALAAYFRFNGREFDQGTYQHPDEITVSNRLARIHWPGPGENLFDVKKSPMNLRALDTDTACTATGCEYPYGALPIYITKAVGWIVDGLTPPENPRKGFFLTNTYGLTLLNRDVSSLFDLITILLVFLIGRRLFSRSAGLIAAALVAFSATHIQLAHFSTVDSVLTTFMIAAVYFSVVLMQRPSWWAAVAAGASIGLAVATKVSVVPFALVVGAAVVLRAVYRKQTRKLGAEFGAPVGLKPASAAERARSFWGHLGRGVIYLPIAGAASLLAFGIAEPYVFWQFDWSRFSQLKADGTPGGFSAVLESNAWWTRIVKESKIQSGGLDDTVYTRQYVGTVPILYHLQNMVFWGLSPVPGFLTLVGFVVALWRAIKRKPADILLLAAALPYFASLLTLEAKWMRYMLPLVPIFCLLGAAFLVRGHIWARARVGATRRLASTGRPVRSPLLPKLQRNIFAVLSGAAVVGAFLWAVAFNNVYSQRHSRLQADEWINRNVPPGANTTSEAWDRGFACPGCQNVELDIYGDPPPDQKFDYFREQLAKADYMFIASNRLYGSVARLPWRYPVHIQFYDLLYAGKLGFQRVYTKHVTPEIFGIRFDDQSADESFSVYDHPRVDIFKKTNSLTESQLRTLFEPALNRPTGDFQVARYGKVTDDKPLKYTEPLASLPDVGDFAWNPLAQEDTQWIAVLLWLLAAQVIGFLALPIVFSVCRNLPDKGYAFAKLLGLLLVSWGAWMAASTRMIPFTVWSVLLMLLIMGGLAALCWRLGAGAEVRNFFRRKTSLVIFYEVLFFIAFALFLYIRILNPDLWHPTNGGEKPMEFGFLNGVLRSPWMPPLDPFFSGGYINYYYHGYVILATLIKLVGVDPAVGVNLAIPLLFALTFTAAASIVYNIVAWSQKRRGSAHEVSPAGIAFGVLAGVLMVGIGNMNGLWQFVMVNFNQWRDSTSVFGRYALIAVGAALVARTVIVWRRRNRAESLPSFSNAVTALLGLAGLLLFGSAFWRTVKSSFPSWGQDAVALFSLLVAFALGITLAIIYDHIAPRKLENESPVSRSLAVFSVIAGAVLAGSGIWLLPMAQFPGLGNAGGDLSRAGLTLVWIALSLSAIVAVGAYTVSYCLRHGVEDRGSRIVLALGVIGLLAFAILNVNNLWQFLNGHFPASREGMSQWSLNMGFKIDSMVRVYDGYNFWDPSRIIPNTINEFPYWSFLFADLHPHLINMPFTIFTVGLALNLAFAGALRRTVISRLPRASASPFRLLLATMRNALGWLWGDGWAGALRFAVMALALGVLAVTNSWDFPTYAALTFGGVVVALFCARFSEAGEHEVTETEASAHGVADGSGLHITEEGHYAPKTVDRWAVVVAGLLSFGLLAGTALLAYIPFFLAFKAFYTKIMPLVDGAPLTENGGFIMHRTTLGEFLVIWLIFLFIALSYLVYRLLDFPWGRALSELVSLGTGRAPAQPASRPAPATPTAQQAFQGSGSVPAIDAARFFRKARPMTLASATPQGSASLTLPTGYAFRSDTGVSPTDAEVPDNGHNGVGDLNEYQGQEHDSSNDGEVVSTQGLTQSESVTEVPQGIDLAPAADGRDALASDSHEELDGGTNASDPATVAPASTPWMSHDSTGNGNLQVVETDPVRQPGNWMVEAHSEAPALPEAVAPTPTEGAIPACAGVILLGVTAALVGLQIATGQLLLALLILLIGGIVATTLVSQRSFAGYFTSALLVVAFSVALAVEVVYLADHLQFDGFYRMNTVFKFYIQIWVLLALGGAAGVYYLIYGLRDRVKNRTIVATEPVAAEDDAALSTVADVAPVANIYPVDAVIAEEKSHEPAGDTVETAIPALRTHHTDNWLVWAGTGPLDSEMVEAEEATPPVPPAREVPTTQPIPRLDTVNDKPGFRLTVGRLVWLGVFALLLMACLVYPLVETPVRVSDRFDVTPPLGTLSGQKYMTTAKLSNALAAPFPMQLKYDYEAIRWMNQNIRGVHVVAERPLGYYREFGVRASSNTGFPTLIGTQHEGEQRYGFQTGPREGEMNEFFTTRDVQRALILISKYDIEYIYLGQMEQAYAGAGLAKFKQMAEPDVGILQQVFRTPEDPEIPGTTIYKVITEADLITGSPVEGSGIPGISLTPIPTAIPTPAPTPPTDDPALAALLADSRATPQDVGKRQKLVDWYRDHGFHEYAARELEAMTKLDDSSVALRHQWGDELMQAGKPEEALEAWKSAVVVARDVDKPAAHNKLGIAYRDRRKYSEALAEFQAVVQIDESWTEGWFHLGETYESLGQRDEARNAYLQTIDMSKNPDDGWVKSARDKLNNLR
jgi:uncharacterized membrane protein/4-amino-4-deoxy-L-arabinose transferase-like glycosyltransferase